MITSRGGLFVKIFRDYNGSQYTLYCVTHKTWSIVVSISAEVEPAEHEEYRARALASAMSQARHRLDTCVCASPLFDPEPNQETP